MTSSITLITIFAVVLLAALIIGMLVSQSRHRSLEQRNNQLKMLNLQQRRLQNLIRTLPPSYLTVELRDFLYQALLHNIKSQMAMIDNQNSILADDYEKFSAEREHARLNPPEGTNEKFTVDQSSMFRGLLKNVHQFVVRNYETGRLKKEDAEKMIRQIEIKLVETALDFFEKIAKERHENKDYRGARNAYQKALENIEQSAQAEQFKQEKVKFKSAMNRIIEEWREEREAASKLGTEKLAGQMEDFVDSQDDWKKKQDYE